MQTVLFANDLDGSNLFRLSHNEWMGESRLSQTTTVFSSGMWEKHPAVGRR